MPRPDLVKLAGIGTGLPAGFVPRCPICRYDLRGLERARCPECGAMFSLSRLLADWEAGRRLGPADWDFWLGGLLSFVCALPVDLRNPGAAGVKLAMLAGLWIVAWVWWHRRRDDLRDPEEGHRLLWLWVPMASTAAALWATPVLNLLGGLVMLAAAIWVMIVAWRRSPGRTSVAVTITLGVPAAGMLIFGAVLFLSAASGRAQGYYWSAADYPSWYWQGVPGRSRGVGNPDAVWMGAAVMIAGAIAITLIVGLWAIMARGLIRRKPSVQTSIAIRRR